MHQGYLSVLPFLFKSDSQFLRTHKHQNNFSLSSVRCLGIMQGITEGPGRHFKCPGALKHCTGTLQECPHGQEQLAPLGRLTVHEPQQQVWSFSSSLDVIIAESVFHEAKKTSSFANEIYLA